MSSPVTIAEFEAASIVRDRWTHRAHLTIAYLYLEERGLHGAVVGMRAGIPRLNAANGVRDTIDMGYHDTVTVAWLMILDALMRTHGPGASPDEFLDANSFLLGTGLLRLYYSRNRLMSPQAKASFVTPDLAPLPTPREADAGADR